MAAIKTSPVNHINISPVNHINIMVRDGAEHPGGALISELSFVTKQRVWEMEQSSQRAKGLSGSQSPPKQSSTKRSVKLAVLGTTEEEIVNWSVCI